jgi:hypothetical protein
MATDTVSRPALGAAAALSIAAGFVHAAVIGHHTEHEQLALLFVGAALFQVGWGLAAFWRPSRLLAWVGLVGNLGAAAFWLVTRMSSVGWIDGLEHKESVAFTDATTAGLGLAAAVAAAFALTSRPALTRLLSLAPVAAVAALLAVAGSVATATDTGSHSHAEEAGHDDGEAAAHDHADGAAAVAGVENADGVAASEHEHADGATATEHEHADGAAVDGPGLDAAGVEHGAEGHDHSTMEGTGTVDAAEVEHGAEGHDMSTMWPRAWNPKQPIDLSGAEGVTKKQQAYGVALVAETLRDLPRFADTADAVAAGYSSIGDSSTGYEHYINYGFISDGKMLDSTAPESLVYQVDGDKRTIASAMYIAESEYPFGSKQLDKLMGGLVTWHNHDNLCWTVVDGQPKVAAVTDNHGGVCPEGTFQAGGEAAMVHVWIRPHECGVFSALEGHGAGSSFDRGSTRVDQCADGHDHGSAEPPQALANWPRPFDPSKPIDLSGVEGVTAEQEQFGVDLIKTTIDQLPRYATQEAAMADGYFSIGDAGTGEEHLIKPQLIADGKMLDPSAPESLVYKAEGQKRTLTGAMFIAEPEYDLGTDALNSVLGPLASWHVHSDVCFDGSGRVAGLADENGKCPEGLVASAAELPMVHVWIAAHECGPFSALEGIGAGQAAEGEANRVDQCRDAEANHGH